MTVNIEIVLSRLQLMSDYLQELKRFESMTLENYLNSFDSKIISERLLELIIQAALDINDHLLSQGLDVRSPENKQLFLNAGRYQIIDSELAEQLSTSAGLRNILAHQYLTINHRLLFGHIQQVLALYPLYVKQITQYLDSLET